MEDVLKDEELHGTVRNSMDADLEDDKDDYALDNNFDNIQQLFLNHYLAYELDIYPVYVELFNVMVGINDNVVPLHVLNDNRNYEVQEKHVEVLFDLHKDFYYFNIFVLGYQVFEKIFYKDVH